MRTSFSPSTQSGFGSASWAIVSYSAQLWDVKGYVWLDYFSIPQCVGKDENCPVTRQQQIDAIVSIPAYVEHCEVFLVLCTCPGASCPIREFVSCWPLSDVCVAQGLPEGPSSQLFFSIAVPCGLPWKPVWRLSSCTTFSEARLADTRPPGRLVSRALA